MLYTENPPPVSSFSCEISRLKGFIIDDESVSDEPGLDLLKSSLDDENTLPTFSIREFVLQNRVKDIKSNWPQQNLQLCLKHGVKDVLSPIQSLRTHSDSTTRSKLITDPVKKRRLTEKLIRVAVISFVPSESMASSQVCPVCRIFSSYSNTTLNAHMDQCLSLEQTSKWISNSKAVKDHIKPRRMRSMTDIYETSRCCTLEDLDLRNGTNWASNLCSLAEDNIQVHKSFDEKNAGVYFDSNGMKLVDCENKHSLLLGKKRKCLLKKWACYGQRRKVSIQDHETMKEQSVDKLVRKSCCPLSDEDYPNQNSSSSPNDECLEPLSLRKSLDGNFGKFSSVGKKQGTRTESSGAKKFSPLRKDRFFLRNGSEAFDSKECLPSITVSEFGNKRLASVNAEKRNVIVDGSKILVESNAHHTENHENYCSLGVDAPGEFERSYGFCCEEALDSSYHIVQGLHPETGDGFEAYKTSYTDYVAPIIIPGPPGCDLPSPGLVDSEELQANAEDFNGNYSYQDMSNSISRLPPHSEENVPSSSTAFKSSTQSQPKPILRLMGKNLMIVNEDDHPSPQTKFRSTKTEHSVANNGSENSSLITGYIMSTPFSKQSEANAEMKASSMAGSCAPVNTFFNLYTSSPFSVGNSSFITLTPRDGSLYLCHGFSRT